MQGWHPIEVNEGEECDVCGAEARWRHVCRIRDTVDRITYPTTRWAIELRCDGHAPVPSGTVGKCWHVHV